jgi:hypothetical protein
MHWGGKGYGCIGACALEKKDCGEEDQKACTAPSDDKKPL